MTELPLIYLSRRPCGCADRSALAGNPGGLQRLRDRLPSGWFLQVFSVDEAAHIPLRCEVCWPLSGQMRLFEDGQQVG